MILDEIEYFWLTHCRTGSKYALKRLKDLRMSRVHATIPIQFYVET